MLPYLGISLDGKYKPALVFKEEDPLGISVINQRLEGNHPQDNKQKQRSD
jgi:hypothetical protein